MTTLDLECLELERGGHLLLERELARLPAGATLTVTGKTPELGTLLRAHCRKRGHDVELGGNGRHRVIRGAAAQSRWQDADRTLPNVVVERPPAHWGLAPRGAAVEASCPERRFALDEKSVVWSDDAGRLYAQAVAAQWDPATAVPWKATFELPAEVEQAVVQVMTYLVENETAALIIPARFVASLHPHFREVMQLLAVQAADEARHIEVFTRRGLLHSAELGLSTAGGQASLYTLLDEPDFALSSFLLSVLGEGSFLSLLAFLRDNAPDPVTREVTRLAAQDEARHVAFGLSHLERQLGLEPRLREHLEAAVRRRHDALATTAGLNEAVFDALVLLAAGSWEHAALRRGWDAVVALVEEMDQGRRKRLLRLGFEAASAAELSALHTRNFM